MTLTIGEVCAGYGGLSLAVETVFQAEPLWFSEFDAAPSKILAHHWPHVPNYGDMTKIVWDDMPRVDILSGGTPCQDLSHAGRRQGMSEGTRSNLWVQMREAIATIRPRYVVWENVRGAYSAKADSSLEPCPGCMGDPPNRGTVLRALGRVLGDLSDLGYDCQWRGLRAADVGAPHGRFRVFILATHRNSQGLEVIRNSSVPPGKVRRTSAATVRDRLHTPDTNDIGHERPRQTRDRWPGPQDGGQPTSDAGSATLWEHPGEPSEEEAWAAGGNRFGHLGGERLTGDRREVIALTAGQRGREGRPEYAGIEGRPDAVIGGDASAADTSSYSGWQRNRDNEAVAWGEYEPAIRRWEATLGRPAPSPTEPTGRNGGHRLSARFAEWMMGVPDGWIVDVPGVSRNEAVTAAGNGVVPQQAIAALRDMLSQARVQKPGEPILAPYLPTAAGKEKPGHGTEHHSRPQHPR